MQFRIALSFNDSLPRRTAEEQKQAKLAAYDLQQDPSNPGHKFHKLGTAKDPRFWCVCVNADLCIGGPAAPTPQSQTPAPQPMALRTVDELRSYGVPEEWIADVRAASENELLSIAEHLPAEAGEAVLELLVVATPRVPEPITSNVSPFDHPDAQRRFRVFHE